jgi:hypothetical protein
MGVNNATTLTREAKVPRGGLSASDLFRLKLTKISATAVITGMVALAALGVPGNANASDYFDRQVGSAVEDISRRTINKASDSIFNVIGGIITGKTLENEAKNTRTVMENRMVDLRNELESMGVPRDKIKVSMDDRLRVVLQGVVANDALKRTAVAIASKYSQNRDVVDRVFVMRVNSEQGQTSGNRLGL